MTNGPATEKGKKFALEALALRRANKPEQIDNSRLDAGSSMYFYCYTCGWLSDVLPEAYIAPPSHLCMECRALKQAGWLE